MKEGIIITRTHTETHTNKQTHTNKHTHIHTQIHTQTRSLSFQIVSGVFFFCFGLGEKQVMFFLTNVYFLMYHSLATVLLRKLDFWAPTRSLAWRAVVVFVMAYITAVLEAVSISAFPHYVRLWLLSLLLLLCLLKDKPFGLCNYCVAACCVTQSVSRVTLVVLCPTF